MLFNNRFGFILPGFNTQEAFKNRLFLNHHNVLLLLEAF